METALNTLKEKAIVIWGFYDDTYWYATEKINRVKEITLKEDAYIIWNMFDFRNQVKLYKMLTEEEKELIGKDNMYYIENSDIDFLAKFIE